MLSKEVEKAILLYLHYSCGESLSDKSIFVDVNDYINHIESLSQEEKIRIKQQIIDNYDILYKKSTFGDNFRNKFFEILCEITDKVEKGYIEKREKHEILKETILGIPKGIEVYEWQRAGHKIDRLKFKEFTQELKNVQNNKDGSNMPS